jgi:hypothetical protein
MVAMKFLQVPEWHYELPMTRQSGLASDSSNLGSDAGLPPLKKDLFLKDLDRAFVRRRPSQGSNSFSKPLYECSHRTKGAQDLHRPFVKTLRPGLQTMDNKNISSLSSQLAKSSSTSGAFSTAASRESEFASSKKGLRKVESLPTLGAVSHTDLDLTLGSRGTAGRLVAGSRSRGQRSQVQNPWF